MSLFDKLRAKGVVSTPRGNSKIAAARNGRGVGASVELRRVAALPSRALDLESVPDLSPLFVREDAECPGCELCKDGPPRLRPVQSAMLIEAEAVGGLFAAVGVGWGKELATLLLPEALGAERAVLLVPPRLKDQLLHVDLPRYRKHFKIPWHRVLAVVTYQELSDADRGDVLERLRPDAVIANEAHKLRHRDAARTRKWRRFSEEVAPEIPVALLSGTMAVGSVRDYAHLIRRALPRGGSPLPTNYRELEDWASALDARPDDEDGLPRMGPGAIVDLMGPAARAEAEAPRAGRDGLTSTPTPLQAAREVFRRRLASTPGVVATSEDSVKCSLVVTARYPERPPCVEELLEEVARTWRIGDDELSDGKDYRRVRRQIASGFYYRWVWPGGEKDLEWLDARSTWHRACRKVLERSRRLDSPLQVSRAAEVGDLGEGVRAAWLAWRPLQDRYKGGQPPVETVRLSDFLARDAVAWGAEGGILWYQSRALGAMLAEAGVPVYGAGAVGDEILRARPDRQPLIAAEVGPHKEGKNLQAYRRNYVLESPANGGDYEQLLGRTHRSGQLADEVECEVAQHDESLVAAFQGALADAHFLQETLGAQKLLYATRIGFETA